MARRFDVFLWVGPSIALPAVNAFGALKALMLNRIYLSSSPFSC
jgi:hypothetical protein